MNEQAQISPIEVVFTLMLTILVMVMLGLTVFPFVDMYISQISLINIPLSSWGQDMMNTYTGYASWVFVVPGFFCLLMIVWAFKTMIRKHEYTAQGQFMVDDFN